MEKKKAKTKTSKSCREEPGGFAPNERKRREICALAMKQSVTASDRAIAGDRLPHV